MKKKFKILLTINILVLLFGIIWIFVKETNNCTASSIADVTFNIGEPYADCLYCLTTITTNHTEYKLTFPAAITDVDYFNGETWEAASIRRGRFIFGDLVRIYPHQYITRNICLSYFNLEIGLHRVRLYSRNSAYLGNRPRRDAIRHITAHFWWTGEKWVAIPRDLTFSPYVW